MRLNQFQLNEHSEGVHPWYNQRYVRRFRAQGMVWHMPEQIRISLPGQGSVVIPDHLLTDKERMTLEGLVERKGEVQAAVELLSLRGYRVYEPGSSLAPLPRCICQTPNHAHNGTHLDAVVQCDLGAGGIDGLCDRCRTHCMRNPDFRTVYTGQPAAPHQPMFCVTSSTTDPKRRHIVHQLGPSLPGDAPRPVRSLCGLTALRYIWLSEYAGLSVCAICNSFQRV